MYSGFFIADAATVASLNQMLVLEEDGAGRQGWWQIAAVGIEQDLFLGHLAFSLGFTWA